MNVVQKILSAVVVLMWLSLIIGIIWSYALIVGKQEWHIILIITPTFLGIAAYLTYLATLILDEICL